MRKSVLSADINVKSLIITLEIQQMYAVVIEFYTCKYSIIFSALVSEAWFRELGAQFETQSSPLVHCYSVSGDNKIFIWL
jgi:hypothetical protein